jgi:hypothetical protein
MFFITCKYFDNCANAEKLCVSCRRNELCKDNFESKSITDDDIYYPKYSNEEEV